MQVHKLLLAAIAVGAVTAATGAAAYPAAGLTADQRVVTVATTLPERTASGRFISGFVAPDTKLVGIDYRIQDGLLYGVGDGGGVYTLSATTGVLTFVNSLSVALDPAAIAFGVDFNPAADRLRIISNTGQNLRHNVNAGGVTLVDGALNNGANPAVAVTNVLGAAYTNNDLVAATGTTLFDINTTTSMVVLQSPPNLGSVIAVGALGVTAVNGGQVGFDIFSKRVNGVTSANYGYAVLTDAGGVSRGYNVNVLTGAATQAGASFPTAMLDIAIRP